MAPNISPPADPAGCCEQGGKREGGWPAGRRESPTGSRVGQKKYVGSWAEDLRRRLVAMDVIKQGMLFAATLLLCLFPFLIVASALAGRW